jgi:hypothetical protein
MKHPTEEQLLEFFNAGDDSQDREHVNTCVECTRRLQRIKSDIEQIVTVLKDANPPSFSLRAPSFSLLRTLAVGAIAASFVVGWYVGAGTGRALRQSKQSSAQADQGPAQTDIAQLTGLNDNNGDDEMIVASAASSNDSGWGDSDDSSAVAADSDDSSTASADSDE